MSSDLLVPGRDYVGIGVGALVFDQYSRVFMAMRSGGARNEAETWEFPGGAVRYGERLEHAVCREFREEYGIEIQPIELLDVFDHILITEQQHWVSVTYIAKHVSGEPEIKEPEKCAAIRWFQLTDLPEPLSQISQDNVAVYNQKYGLGPT